MSIVSCFVFRSSKLTAEQLAEALAADLPGLADVLEALGVQVGTMGATHFLGAELRRVAREMRDDLMETTQVEVPIWSKKRRLA